MLNEPASTWSLMGNSKKSRVSIQLTTTEDASLWRYTSVTDALQANLDIVASLIKSGSRHQHHSAKDGQPQSVPLAITSIDEELTPATFEMEHSQDV